MQSYDKVWIAITAGLLLNLTLLITHPALILSIDLSAFITFIAAFLTDIYA